jgi:aryl-alcohol dehydrogenase-like predicted oxidoreductase
MLPELDWRGSRIPRLVAGTAQLGMAYGIANHSGPPGSSNAAAVVQAAAACGVRFFDTAQAYGDSESFLGKAFRKLPGAGAISVISKLHPELVRSDEEAVLRSVEQSVERLGRPLWAMLLHRAGWLASWDRGLGMALHKAQRRGLVAHLGVSVYTVKEARQALAHEEIDIVQIPASAWDQRMLRAGIFQLAAAQGKLCFARSIFLQGLLVLAPALVAARLPLARPAAERWKTLAAELGLTPEALAVRCALRLPAPLVVGMETTSQVHANAALFETEALPEDEYEDVCQAMVGVVDERILNPSGWQEPI